MVKDKVQIHFTISLHVSVIVANFLRPLYISHQFITVFKKACHFKKRGANILNYQNFCFIF